MSRCRLGAARAYTVWFADSLVDAAGTVDMRNGLLRRRHAMIVSFE